MTNTVTDENRTAQEEIPGLECTKFLANERCDRCGARAYARAHFMNGIIRLCGHHFKAHRPYLESNAIKTENGLPQLEWEEENSQMATSFEEGSNNNQKRFGFGKNSK